MNNFNHLLAQNSEDYFAVEIDPAKRRAKHFYLQQPRYPISIQILFNYPLDHFFTLPDRPLLDLAVEFSEAALYQITTYPSRNKFEEISTIYGLYTNNPASHLQILLHDNKLIGLIYIKRFARNLMHLQGIPLVFITKEGTINAFNAEFLSRFHSDLSNPENILDKPSRKFLSPDPYAFINAAHAKPQTDWNLLHRFDNTHDTLIDWLPDNVVFSNGKALWESTKRPDFLPFRFHTNTFKYDYKISIRFVQHAGTFPVFILNGAPLGKFYWPDLTGYQFGFTEHTNFFRIKKAGYIVQESQTAIPSPSIENEIVITKVSSRISCMLNGETVCTFKDSHTMDRKDGLFYIASRDEAKIEITSMQIEHTERAAAHTAMENDFSLLNGTDNRFIFFQLLEKSAYIDGRFHYALTLYDVSQVLNKVKQLESDKERTEIERDRYKTLSEDAGLLKNCSFLGDAPPIIKLRDTAKRAAQSDITILIEGETGTGKTLLANYIHEHSPFSDGPFVVVDCASLPESVLESELFGHVKGAFTGAIKDRIGKFEEAKDGTLFLDEIGNIPLHTQAKLLSFLQNYTIQKIGSNKTLKVRTRIITATNRNLQKMVDTGLFRADLFYRLNTISFDLPPLREHATDIPLLSRFFINSYNRRFNRKVKFISPEVDRFLLSHSWPGNIRELENTIQKAVLFCSGDTIDSSCIDFLHPDKESATVIKGNNNEMQIPKGNARALKKEHILYLLEKSGGIVRWAAKEAEVGEATFFRKLRKFGIKRE